MTTKYKAFFAFGGAGAGARGFAQARVATGGREAGFEVVGGFDNDPAACADFEYLTGVPQACADVLDLTCEDVRRIAGSRAPDVVFLSPPCKGGSGLLSESVAKQPKYRAMNELALVWVRLMLQTWAEPPRLVLLENVPRLKKRAAGMLFQIRSLLTAAGYVCTDGFHDCGELGGLAQHRRRYLLVARHTGSVAPLLYQPPCQRVRACGEVLGSLPLPGDPVAGPMHRLPKISWLNWVRLALIPAGGDWRDLAAMIDQVEAGRTRFASDEAPAGTDWPGPEGLAQLRVRTGFDHAYMVLPWSAPSPTVAGTSHPGCGAYSVADPRLRCTPRAGAYGVIPWTQAAKTVTGSASIDNGPFAVSDPRPVARPLAGPADRSGHRPGELPVIIAADGTWHRPMTALELAVLQGFPSHVAGVPLKLAGSSSNSWRERIGNAVPIAAATAIAEQMLRSLQQADHGAFTLASSSNPVWVEPSAAVAA
jgi:site-specific DNA-cytosine methylase